MALDGMVAYLISRARARGIGSRGAWNVYAGNFYLKSASLRAAGSGVFPLFWTPDLGCQLAELPIS